MKKRSIINLIKYYSENNDSAFRNEAENIARDFDREGDSEIASYIISLLSDVNVFVPQMSDSMAALFERIEINNENLWLPDDIMEKLKGIINAATYHKGINKFLFYGMPGTGKTEAVKQVARILNRELFMVNFPGVVDSKLGNTGKNIVELFREINSFPKPEKLIILFDEIDALALDRTNQQDHREMGRATSGLLKELDRLRPEIVLVATTNLFDHFDKALIRRFDAIVDFDKYSELDLYEISEKFLDKYLKEFHLTKRDLRLFKKIYENKEEFFSPGELKNQIRSSIAFSDPNKEGDYLRKLYSIFCGKAPDNVEDLKKQGFTVREISVLMGKSKSTVDRELKERGSNR